MQIKYAARVKFSKKNFANHYDNLELYSYVSWGKELKK